MSMVKGRREESTMKVKPAVLLLAGFNLLYPLAAFAKGAGPAGESVPPPASDKPTMVDLRPEEEPGEENPLPREGLVRMEVFTLSREAARTATRKFPKQADLYAWLGAELEKENPTVKLERLMVLRVRGGQRSKLEEINEYPFPTEFDPPKIPQSIGIGQPAPATTTVNVTAPTPPPVPPAPAPPSTSPGAKGESGPSGTPAALPRPAGSSPPGPAFSPWPYSPATPHTFQFKETGWTVEIELTMSDDGETVDLSIAPEFIRLCGLESQSPSGEVVQPVFETSKIATYIQTKLGHPTLAGTFSPPINTGVDGGNLETVTRLLFLTVTEPR